MRLHSPVRLMVQMDNPNRMPVHGWLALDKPAGVTSAQAVSRVRRLMRAAKAGHGGTLDPLATGVLPIAFGEATKTVSYVVDGSKEYEFTLCWGQARATDDSEGEIIATSDIRPDAQSIRAALGAFIGKISQVPPVFSAKKIGGRRAYDLARSNQPVELEANEVTIDSIVLLDTPDPDHACFEVRCRKGVYIRSLARDIAVGLGTVGYVEALRRTAVGAFHENQAITLDKLESLGHSSPPVDLLLPVETALDDIPALALTETQAGDLRQGRPVRLGHMNRVSPFGKLDEGTVLCAMDGGKLVALARLKGGEVCPVRVLNL